MKRYIIGSVIAIIGSIPFLLLAVSAMGFFWFNEGPPVEIHKNLLIAGGVVFVGGFAIREWGSKIKSKVRD